MNRRFIGYVTLVIVLQFAGFMIFRSKENGAYNSARITDDVLAAIKEDPEYAKALQAALASGADVSSPGDSQDQQGPQGEPGTPGADGSNGRNGSDGASGISGIVGLQQGGTGQTGAQAALNALLPAQSGNQGKVLGTDGTTPSWRTMATGGSALSVVRTPRAATTTITADQVKAGLMVSVDPSSGTNEDRPKIVLPSPVTDTSLQGHIIQLLSGAKTSGLSRMGASLGYESDLSATLGDFASLSPSSVDFSSQPLTVTYEVNGSQKQVTLTQDYSSQAQNIIPDLFAEAIAEDTVEFIGQYDLPGNSSYLYAGVTKAKGDQASFSIVDPGAGDPLGLSSLTATPGFTGYLGYDGGELGVGELNESNPIGSGYTHTWPDDPYGADQQTLTLIATEDGWRSLKTAYRSEFLNYKSLGTYYFGNQADDPSNVGQALHLIDEELYNIRARLDALEP